MAITHPPRLLTADDLEAIGSEIKLLDRYDGVVRETEPMGGRHGEFQFEISSPLHAPVRAHPRALQEGETLDSGDVIPGFRLPVAGIFA